MEFRELSSAPTNRATDHKSSSNSSSTESESKPCRKRKFCSDHRETVDLQFRKPLPVDWEQCLDLESGRMYYFNRKTAKKARSWPEEQKLDLELNISCSKQSDKSIGNKCSFLGGSETSHPSSSNNMVALACLNCHLLVMLSESSPSCPNCKHLHSLGSRRDPLRRMAGGVESLSTLSLLN